MIEEVIGGIVAGILGMAVIGVSVFAILNKIFGWTDKWGYEKWKWKCEKRKQYDLDNRLKAAKEKFEKHKFLHDYAKKMSELFYCVIKDNVSKSEKTNRKRLKIKIWPRQNYVCSFFGYHEYDDCYGDPQKLYYVRDYNMSPLEEGENVILLNIFLADLITENMKELLRVKPIDKKYEISWGWDNGYYVLYEAENDAYLSHEW